MFGISKHRGREWLRRWSTRRQFQRWVVDELFLLFPTVALSVVLHEYGTPFWPSLAVGFVVSIMVSALIQWAVPMLLGVFLGRRGELFAYISFIVFVALVALTWRAALNGLAGASENDALLALRVYFSGVAIGIVLRTAITQYFFTTLTCRDADQAKRLLIVIISIAIVLLPSPASMPFAIPCHLWGVASGFLLHFGFRTTLRARAQRARQTKSLIGHLDLRGRPANWLTSREEDAVHLIARGKYSRAIKYLESSGNSGSTAIIRACAHRAKREFDKARTELERTLDGGSIDPQILPSVHCLLGVCRGERDLEQKMEQSFQAALALDPNCILSRLLTGLRTAEKSRDFGSVNIPARATIWSAVERIQDMGPVPLEKELLGRAVGMSWTSLIDALGYGVAKAGHIKLGLTYLSSCIHTDPSYSSPYMHLGEIYMEEARRDAGTRVLGRESHELRRLAVQCFEVAIHLESGGEEGLVRRRSRSLLDGMP